MASSQVEIAPSLPFDRVLKDHNPHDACTTHAAFEENIKTFVRDNLNACNAPISHDSASNQNTHKPNNDADTWVSRVAKNNLGTLSFKRRNHNTCKDKDDSSLPALVSPRHSRIVDRWAARQAQEMVPTALENHRANKALKDFPSRSSSFAYRREVSPSCVVDGSSESEISNLGASSLVQIWEKRLNHFDENAFGQVTSCPRIRGRRAFNDLFMQLENDRYRELNNLAQRGAVSKFTHRGRIQSLLRLRLLQRGVAAEQSCHKSETSKVNSQPQGYAIMQLRERFSTGVEHKSSAMVEVSDLRRPHGDIANNITKLDHSPIINQLSKASHCKAVYGTGIHCAEPAQNSMLQASANSKEEAYPSSHVIFQGTCFVAQSDDAPEEIIRASSSKLDSIANEMANKVDASDQQYITTETSYNDIAEQENASNQQYAESNYDEIGEEEEVGDQNYDEASYDWINPISRPRSYWEERRQEWYREMLDFGSDNDEIRNLLQRRTVSTFLSSDFRERMDRLLKSSMGAQTSQDDDEDNQESRDQLMAFFHERLNSKGIPSEDRRDKVRAEEEEEKINEEQEEKEERVEEQEEGSIINDSDHESNFCSSQSSPSMHTSSPLRTWSYKDNEVGDDYDKVTYISSQPPPQSQSFYQDSRQCSSSTSHHSIEMEFLYDLRGQMDQLFHEISELRKSIKSCIDMQMQLQQFNNQEVYSVKEEDKKFHDRMSKKGNCCICYRKKVAAVLYRCGHMCTCLKCANELQWKGENCPICKATIIDVVRVHDDK